MPLGQGIVEMWDAVRDRVEVEGHGPLWRVTAGSFDSALGYANERFENPVVLARADRNRWWPRCTLTVTTDPALGASAPPLEDIAAPPAPAEPTTPTVPVQRRRRRRSNRIARSTEELPTLDAIFEHQEELRIARQRTPDHDNVSPAPESRSRSG